MDIFKDISESNNRDIVIQLDGRKSWLEHIRFLGNLKDEDHFFEQIVNDSPKTLSGNKCYISYNGKVCGWLEIYSIEKKGKKTLLKMYPYFNNVECKMDIVPFREKYRYFYDNSHDQ